MLYDKKKYSNYSEKGKKTDRPNRMGGGRMKIAGWLRKFICTVIPAAMIMGMGITANAAEIQRNTEFTTMESMRRMTGNPDPDAWQGRYLPEVERYYWNFSPDGQQENREITMDMVSAAYRNLEMFLDNGYLLDYNKLAAYTQDYLQRRGMEDAYYLILQECLKNPYLLNKPEAVVTDTTYNGRDYSSVFECQYYYDHNPDLQQSIGLNPPELLRHFVEQGIMQGRQGRADFSINDYMKTTDQQIAATLPGGIGVAKYSYSPANYYGKLLGHYDYSSIDEIQDEDM